MKTPSGYDGPEAKKLGNEFGAIATTYSLRSKMNLVFNNGDNGMHPFDINSERELFSFIVATYLHKALALISSEYYRTFDIFAG